MPAGRLTSPALAPFAFSPSTNGVSTLNLPAITIVAGTVALENGADNSKRTLLLTSALTINGGRLDLGANFADLVGGGASGLSDAATAVHRGYASGSWNGTTGIMSSTAAANTTHLTALGTII